MTPLVNKDYLLGMAGNDQETFLSIVEEFQENSTQIIVQIQDILEQGAPEKIAPLAHQLKGSSGMLGMEQIFEFCQKIESMDSKKIDSTLLEEISTCLKDSVQLAKETLS